MLELLIFSVCYLSLSGTGFFNSFFFFFLSFSSSSSSSTSSDSEPSALSSLADPEPLSSLPLPLSEPLAESDSGGEEVGVTGREGQLFYTDNRDLKCQVLPVFFEHKMCKNSAAKHAHYILLLVHYSAQLSQDKTESYKNKKRCE